MGSLRSFTGHFWSSLTCGNYPKIISTRVNEWGTTNGLGSFPRCLDTQFRSRKFSCTIGSMRTALLDGGRQPTESSVARLSSWRVRSPIRTSRRRNGKN